MAAKHLATQVNGDWVAEPNYPSNVGAAAFNYQFPWLLETWQLIDDSTIPSDGQGVVETEEYSINMTTQEGISVNYKKTQYDSSSGTSTITTTDISTIINYNSITTRSISTDSITFTGTGYKETSSSTTTTYGQGNSIPCPQLLLVDGHVHIYLDSVTPRRIYHAFWKSESQSGTITFYRLDNDNWTIQKVVSQSSTSNADGGVIFVHDGSDYFSIGGIPGV